MLKTKGTYMFFVCNTHVGICEFYILIPNVTKLIDTNVMFYFWLTKDFSEL